MFTSEIEFITEKIRSAYKTYAENGASSIIQKSHFDLVTDIDISIEKYLSAEIIKKYGEERWASRISNFIVNRRKQGEITSTGQLVDIIKAAIPASARREGPHPAKRTFQAIRIEVNRELDAITPSGYRFDTVAVKGGATDPQERLDAAIDRCDVALLLIDAQVGVTEQVQKYLRETAKPDYITMKSHIVEASKQVVADHIRLFESDNRA